MVDGQAALMLSTIMHGDFWRESGEGEQYLAGRQVPEELRDVLCDLTTFVADKTARAMQAVVESPGLLEEYQALDAAGDWEDGDLLTFKAAMIAAGLL